MGGSEERRPTISPDQGATDETATSSKNMDVRTQTHTDEDVGWNVILKMLDNIKARDPEGYWDIIIETLFKCFARENRGKRSEKPEFFNLDKLEALENEHLETSGSVTDDLKKRMEWVERKEEFDNYVTLLEEARACFGCDLYYIITLYISKHKGEYYCIKCEHECN